jgi:hypothetical protein
MSNRTTNHHGRTTLSGLSALGSNQTTAFMLLNAADHQFTTVGSSTSAVLPSAKLPSSLTVYNGGANTLAVYPPVGGTINGGSVNADITVSAGSGAEFFAADTLTWYTAAAGSGGSGTVTSVVAGSGLTGGTITTTGTIALATTGLEIDQSQSAITADTDGATITFNLALTNWHTVTVGGNRTLAVSGGVTGQQFTLVLVQDGTGSRTVTWFSGIKWAGGSAPTLTTTANKADIFTFKQTGTGAYYGMIAGQNF